MDFKVTGTHKGITAIQMDIKIHGLTRPIVEEAIARTREARLYIMDEVMSKAISKPRKEVGVRPSTRSLPAQMSRSTLQMRVQYLYVEQTKRRWRKQST